jgi:AAA domain
MEYQIFQNIYAPSGRGHGRARGRDRGRGRGRVDQPVDVPAASPHPPAELDVMQSANLKRAFDNLQDLIMTLSFKAILFPCEDDKYQPKLLMGIGQLYSLTDLFLRVSFVNDGHACHISLWFSYKKEDVVIRISPCALLESSMTFKELDATAKAIYVDPERPRSVLSDDTLYQLTLDQLDINALSTQNLWVDSEHLGSVRTAFSSPQRLLLIIKARPMVASNYNAFLEAYAAERVLLSRGQSTWSQWYPKHPLKPSIQYGDYPAPSERPFYVYDKAKCAFFDLAEYLTVHGFGTIAEQEYVEQIKGGAGAIHDVELKLLTMPGTQDRLYIGVLNLSRAPDLVLTIRDRLTVNFDIEIDSSAEHWFGTVIEPLPFVPVSDFMILLHRPWDPEIRSFLTPKTILHVLRWSPKIRNHQAAAQALYDASPNPIRLRVLDSDTHFRRQLNTLRVLPTVLSEDRELEAALLANAPIKLPPRDLFRPYRAETPRIEECLELSEQQIQRAKTFSRVHGPIALLLGPPGTGKTYLATHLVLGLLSHPRSAKVLLVSSMNNSVDAFLEKLTPLTSKQPRPAPRKPVMIIRLHNLNTEMEVSLQPAKRIRNSMERSRPNDWEEAIYMADIDRAQYASVIHAHYQRTIADKRSHGITDKRLQLIDLSLGMWMLRIAGLVDAGGPFDQKNQFGAFRNLYMQYSSNLLEDTDMIKFRAAAKQLRVYTLAAADMVACTLSQCADPSLTRNFLPTLTIVEEAARAVEVDTLMPLVWYKPELTLLLGDPNQLPPFVQSSSTYSGNIFAAQTQTSLFARLKGAGFECPLLNENYRQQPEAAAMTARLGYTREGLEYITPCVPFPEEAARVKAFNLQHYCRETPILWLDIPQGKTVQIERTRSRFNTCKASVALQLMVNLLEEGVARSSRSIIILVPYQAQIKVLSTAIGHLQQNHRHLDLAGLSVTTIDGYQGKEKKIVICDMVVCRELGFMHLNNRLVVMMSRSQVGLYILGNSAEMEKNRGRFGRSVGALISYTKQHYMFWTIKDAPFMPEIDRVEADRTAA